MQWLLAAGLALSPDWAGPDWIGATSSGHPRNLEQTGEWTFPGASGVGPAGGCSAVALAGLWWGRVATVPWRRYGGSRELLQIPRPHWLQLPLTWASVLTQVPRTGASASASSSTATDTRVKTTVYL